MSAPSLTHMLGASLVDSVNAFRQSVDCCHRWSNHNLVQGGTIRTLNGCGYRAFNSFTWLLVPVFDGDSIEPQSKPGWVNLSYEKSRPHIGGDLPLLIVCII